MWENSYSPAFTSSQVLQRVPFELGIAELQSKMGWDVERYGDEYQENPATMKHVEHALLHVIKATGKIAAIVEHIDHMDDIDVVPADVEGYDKYVADILICAVRLACVGPEPTNLAGVVHKRMQEKEAYNKRVPSSALEEEDGVGAHKMEEVLQNARRVERERILGILSNVVNGISVPGPTAKRVKNLVDGATASAVEDALVKEKQ